MYPNPAFRLDDLPRLHQHLRDHALALLISAAVMNRSLLALRAVDPGFDTEGRLVLSVSLPVHITDPSAKTT